MKQELRYESVKTAIRTLYTVDAVAEKFFIPVDTVKELAAGDFIPHYKVAGIDQLLFNLDETKSWVSENLVHHVKGAKLPPPTIQIVAEDAGAVIGSAPSTISNIPGLRLLVPELLCGVYFLCRGDEVVYIGESEAIPVRTKNHKDKEYDRIFFLRVPASHRKSVEYQFISKLQPRYNKQGISKPVKEQALALHS